MWPLLESSNNFVHNAAAFLCSICLPKVISGVSKHSDIILTCFCFVFFSFQWETHLPDRPQPGSTHRGNRDYALCVVDIRSKSALFREPLRLKAIPPTLSSAPTGRDVYMRDALRCHSEWHSKGAAINTLCINDRLIMWKKMQSSWPHLSINGHNCLHKSVQHCCSANQEHYHTSYTKCPIQTYMHSHTEPGVRPQAFQLEDNPLCVLAEPWLIHKTVSSGRQLQWVFSWSVNQKNTDFIIGSSLVC